MLDSHTTTCSHQPSDTAQPSLPSPAGSSTEPTGGPDWTGKTQCVCFASLGCSRTRPPSLRPTAQLPWLSALQLRPSHTAPPTGRHLWTKHCYVAPGGADNSCSTPTWFFPQGRKATVCSPSARWNAARVFSVRHSRALRSTGRMRLVRVSLRVLLVCSESCSYQRVEKSQPDSAAAFRSNHSSSLDSEGRDNKCHSQFRGLKAK